MAPRPPRHSLVVLLLTVALFSAVSLLVLAPPRQLILPSQRYLVRPVSRALASVPLPDAVRGHFERPNSLAVAVRSFSHYSHAQHQYITRKYTAYDRMPRRHKPIGDKLGWKTVLKRADDSVELNTVVTDELAAIGLEQAKREGVLVGLRSHLYKENGRVVETLKHFVRDWADEGKAERDALFPPILQALDAEFSGKAGRRVLVPGCGLGRLAYEIALQDSHYMNLGAQFIFNRTHSANQHMLAPWLHGFSHQRTPQELLRRVTFPDIKPEMDKVDLKLTPGNFLEIGRKSEAYDAIVTLFFIDTAQNMLAYFETILFALKPGGIWINEGPLLYWGNPTMELPLEYVIRAAEALGFQIERRKALKGVEYTADGSAMYSFAYDCEFWVARKPLAAETAAGNVAAASVEARKEL
ncbi:hypothetical protein Rhopal_002921-T1 [Rhodotorula paludigena]|uniref:N2227-domain-containing protein n=1 Tax=Rhodotorula paludigena TaxID=86838 RepID=A0AAV5GLL6_9BASI|nr:hypothetical protein Rhopal_002921-T1 [Rhodotorula paludigena]